MARRWPCARPLFAVVAAALALPALAYLLPTTAVLKHLGLRREALAISTLQVEGTLQALGHSAELLQAVLGQPAGAPNLPARLLIKVPGRCRLEIAGATPADSPYLLLREGRPGPEGALASDPAATALVRAVCTLLATSTAGDASQNFAAALARRGVSLADESLGRFDGRLAYVIGGRPHDPKPLLFVDKDGFQPLRLVAAEGGALLDVRLLGWGSPTGGDWFPRAVEVAEGEDLRLRFTTERTSANAHLPEGAL